MANNVDYYPFLFLQIPLKILKFCRKLISKFMKERRVQKELFHVSSRVPSCVVESWNAISNRKKTEETELHVCEIITFSCPLYFSDIWNKCDTIFINYFIPSYSDSRTTLFVCHSINPQRVLWSFHPIAQRRILCNVQLIIKYNKYSKIKVTLKY